MDWKSIYNTIIFGTGLEEWYFQDYPDEADMRWYGFCFPFDDNAINIFDSWE